MDGLNENGMKKKLFCITFTLLLICTACIIVCNRIIADYAAPRLYSDTKSIPYNEVGLLPGTAPKLKNGKNNLYFDYRIAAAATLYRAGKIKYILISGDNGREDYNEPEEMKKALLAQGIPEGAIYLDYAGFRTLDSVVRAKEIFGQKKLTVLSQAFHNERAVYLAGKNGMEAVGFNAKDVETYAGLKTQIRELFAGVKVFVDLAIGKRPHFLGERIQIGEKE